MTLILGCIYFKRNKTSSVEICVISKEVNVEHSDDALNVNDFQSVCGFCETCLGKL